MREKLANDGLTAEPVGSDALAVSTSSRPRPAVIVVPEPMQEVFGVPQLNVVTGDYPAVDAVLLIRRPADEAVFTAASERSIQIDTFGNVVRALEEQGEMSRYQHPKERYLRSRISRLPAVRKIHRIGLSAWGIERNNGRTLLKIITHDRYEFPVSELRQVLNTHPTFRPDAVVITNPNASGFSTVVTEIAQQEGVRLLLLPDFIEGIRHATI